MSKNSSVNSDTDTVIKTPTVEELKINNYTPPQTNPDGSIPYDGGSRHRSRRRSSSRRRRHHHVTKKKSRKMRRTRRKHRRHSSGRL